MWYPVLQREFAQICGISALTTTLICMTTSWILLSKSWWARAMRTTRTVRPKKTGKLSTFTTVNRQRFSVPIRHQLWLSSKPQPISTSQTSITMSISCLLEKASPQSLNRKRQEMFLLCLIDRVKEGSRIVTLTNSTKVKHTSAGRGFYQMDTNQPNHHVIAVNVNANVELAAHASAQSVLQRLGLRKKAQQQDTKQNLNLKASKHYYITSLRNVFAVGESWFGWSIFFYQY